jgi:hypothetical protein
LIESGKDQKLELAALGIVAVVEHPSLGTVAVVEVVREDQLFEAQDMVDDRGVLAEAGIEVEVVMGLVQPVVVVGLDDSHLACFYHFAS